MRAWLRQHARAIADALRRTAAQKSVSAVSALVIGVALSLPVGGYALLDSLRPLSAQVPLEPQLSVFLRQRTDRAQARALAARLQSDARVASVRFVPREEALAELRAADELAEMIAALGRNPLPDAIVLHARKPDAADLDAFAAELRASPLVAHVQADSAWARRLAALAGLARLAFALLSALLGAALVAVTFNTIRLQIVTRREEILVCKLIGATDAFVQRPFYYLGLIQGLAGGAVALVIVWGGLALLNFEVGSLADSFGSAFRLRTLTGADVVAVLAIAAGLGWAGAYMSVSRHLRDID